MRQGRSLRVASDITGGGPFNAVFSLTGAELVPESSTLMLLALGLGAASWERRRRR